MARDDESAAPGISSAPGEDEAPGGEDALAPDMQSCEPPPSVLGPGMLGLASTLRALSALGLSKSKINPAQGIIMGWQSAAYLSFAAFLTWAIMATVSADLSVGLAMFMAFCMFGLCGRVMIILHGSNAVTGDFMIAGISLMTRQARWREVLWSWTVTHAGHWMGGCTIAWIIIAGASQAGPVGSMLTENLASIGTDKVYGLPWDQLFYRGILANWLIAIGVWGGFRVKSTTAKMLIIAAPVSIFFATGFEHSIVNHFALSAGIWAGGEYTWGEAWFNNLVPVTLGNIIGGMLFHGMTHWYAGGMQTWTGPGRWRRRGTARDFARAARDSFTLMFFFVGVAPLVAGLLLLYAVEPALGVAAGAGNANWVEPVCVSLYLAATALVIKQFLMPRVWHSIPDE